MTPKRDADECLPSQATKQRDVALRAMLGMPAPPYAELSPKKCKKAAMSTKKAA